MELRYCTQGESSPQGKQRVYFTCHPRDFRKFFERTKNDILNRQNCAVFYLEPGDEPTDTADYELSLSQMQLFVVPVTTLLLTTPNRTMDHDVPFAIAHNIPLLPIMQEIGLADSFNSRFGSRQFLDRTSVDPTEIPYEEKLDKFLETVITGDETIRRIREAFDAYVFLSYRKKDRKHAQLLMNLIHSDPRCRDTAIWYDEFLTPGENFDSAISDALKKSDLFALVVTPNLVNEKNYVMEHEYPMAVSLSKPILPVEMVNTSGMKLNRLYKGCPKPVRAKKEKEFAQRLSALLSGTKVSGERGDPEHCYLMGMAYLRGIDVEVDHGRAIELITKAANGGDYKAIVELINIYFEGNGVPRDCRAAAEWIVRLAELCEKKYEAEPGKENAAALIDVLWHESDAYEAYGRFDKSEKALLKMYELCVRFNEEYDDAFLKSQALCCRSLAAVADKDQDYAKREKYLTLAADIDGRLAQKTDSVTDKRTLAIDYEAIGGLYFDKGDLDEAEKWYNKAYEIVQAIVDETGSNESRSALAGCYRRFGKLAVERGDTDGAEQMYMKALAIEQAMLDEPGDGGSRRDLAITYDALGHLEATRENFQQAWKWYMEALKIAQKLSDSSGMLIDRGFLAATYNDVGDVYVQTRMPGEADKCYRESLKIYESIMNSTGSIEARDDYAATCYKMGDRYAVQKNYPEAEKWYRRSIDIREKLLSERDTLHLRRSMSLAYSMLANMALVSVDPRKRAEAAVWLKKSLEMDEEIAKRTGTVKSLDDLACSYYNTGVYTRDRSMFEKALAIWQGLSEQCPDVPLYQRRIRDTYDALEKTK